MFFHKIAETKGVCFSPTEVQLGDVNPELKIGGLIFTVQSSQNTFGSCRKVPPRGSLIRSR